MNLAECNKLEWFTTGQRQLTEHQTYLRNLQEMNVYNYLPEQAMLVANNTFCFCFFFFLPELDPLSPETLFN